MTHHEDPKLPAERRRVRVRPWWLIAAAVCLLGGLVLPLTFVDPAAYHWWQYERLTSRDGDPGYPTMLDNIEESLFDEHWIRADAHLKALMSAGEIELLAINLSHHENTPAQQKVLIKILSDGYRRNKLVYWAAPSGKPEQTLTISIYCRPEHSKEWRQFFEAYDTPADAPTSSNKESE